MQLGPLRIRMQNLNIRPGDRHFEATGNPFVHGRAWLRFWEQLRPEFEFTWAFGRQGDFCHLYTNFDGGENDITVSAAIPGAAFWLSCEGLPNELFKLLGLDWETVRESKFGTHGLHRQIGVSFDRERVSLRWDIWAPQGYWSKEIPRWMDGHFEIADAILGEHVYSERNFPMQHVEIPMPEGTYKATLVMQLATWKRARWPFPLTVMRAKIEVPEGIPVPGKGENSWDCGPDALYGTTCRANTPEAAIATLVESVLRTRKQRCGSHVYTERPKPSKPSPDEGASQAAH